MVDFNCENYLIKDNNPILIFKVKYIEDSLLNDHSLKWQYEEILSASLSETCNTETVSLWFYTLGSFLWIKTMIGDLGFIENVVR